VLLASDLNPRYIESWRYTARAWREVAGVEPLLVLVGDPPEIPAEFANDPAVHVFPRLENVPTAFHAQCVRLLYPALVETSGAVLISDMELVPLDPRYFHRPLSVLDERLFVSYRDLALDKHQIAIPYNAARPETWSEIFAIVSLESVRARLLEWATETEYSAVRGGEGWYTDQEKLYEYVMPWAEHTGRMWMLDDLYTGFNRLNRPELKRDGGVTATRRRELAARRYTDYNSAVPFGQYRELNELVLELALAALR
jgi:hypothetical protein